MPLRPEQCRAARALLDWTQEELATRAGVSPGTVRGFEGGRHDLQRATAAVLRQVLELAGIALLEPDDQGGAGVRLRRDADAALPAGPAPPPRARHHRPPQDGPRGAGGQAPGAPCQRPEGPGGDERDGRPHPSPAFAAGVARTGA